MKNIAMLNGIKCLVAEGRRIKKEDAPPGYPHFYHGRHSSNDMSIPVSIESFVCVNFWGTIFASEPLIEEGLDFVNIKSIEYKGLSLDSMPNVCPVCAGCLATGNVVVSGSTVYQSVECGCGYKGREEYSMTSYTAHAADEESEGEEPDGSIVCPCCHAAVVLPAMAQMDYDCLDVEVSCPFCSATVDASISCLFEGYIPLPMPA
jgi:Large polyvalent protein associated domain 28